MADKSNVYLIYGRYTWYGIFHTKKAITEDKLEFHDALLDPDIPVWSSYWAGIRN